MSRRVCTTEHPDPRSTPPGCPSCDLWRRSERFRRWCEGGPPPPSKIERTTKQPSDVGPGTELMKLLADMGIQVKNECACKQRARQMNKWGVEGCIEHRQEIISWLKEAQAKQTWGATIAATLGALSTIPLSHLSVIDPVGSLVDEAIRRARG